MKRSTLRPRDPRHDLLIRAVLSPGERGEAAYRDWRQGVDVMTLDHPSLSLLAPLSRRLDGRADDAIAKQITKVARMTWLRGNMLLSNASAGMRAMVDEDIPVMLVKGAAVLHHAGLEIGRRPMGDVDVCVPVACLSRAAHALVRAGFRSPLESLLAGRPDDVASGLHAVGFSDERGASIDLHWHLLATSLHPDADAPFWAAAEPAEWRGVPVCASSREHTLLHVIVHGSQFNPDVPLRWATDAALLCDTGAVDWDALATSARRHRAAALVGEALTYLREIGAVDVPDGSVEALVADRGSPTARLLGHGSRLPGRPGHVARAMSRDLARHVSPEREPSPRDVARLVTTRRRALHGPAPSGLEPVTFGVPLRCVLRADGYGARHLTAGWHYPEPHGTWSRDARARIVLPLAEPSDDPLLLDLELVAFVSPRRPRLRVDLAAGGRRLGSWEFHGVEWRGERRSVWIPGIAGRTTVDVVLHIQHPMTGAESGTTGEERALGLSVSTLCLRRATVGAAAAGPQRPAASSGRAGGPEPRD